MANAEHVAYKGIRDLFEYALYKFTLYLLTYLHVLKTPKHDKKQRCRRGL